jgi:hypothetical protein
VKQIVIVLVALMTIAVAVEPWQLPEAKMTVRVTGEDGAPVIGATVKIVFMKASGPQGRELEEAPATGLTDTSGEFSAAGTCHQDLMATVDRAGYYHGVTKALMFTKALERKWQPWNPTLEVVLKKIEKPMPMYAKNVDTDLPVSEQPIGFDLAEGDWVAPHGRGKASDLIFKLQSRFNDARDYESSLEVSFSSKADGIQAWDNEAEYRSALKLPRLAPENGYVQPLLLSNTRVPSGEVERDVKENRNYFLRVRTVLDPQGKVVSALYGKIDGDIRFSPIRSKTCSLMFTYYLNPTANERNVEFDVQRNLLTNLKDGEQVNAP